MATVTHRDTRAVTTNAATYASNAFTPAASELLVAFAVVSGTVAAGTMTDSQGLGFTKIDSALHNTSADTLYLFVADALAAASSMTVTMDVTGDNGTGCVLFVAGVSGMTRLGNAAVRQTRKNENIGGTPAPNFLVDCLTENPTLGCIGTQVNPAALTPPTDWTEAGDTGYATPTKGGEYVFRDSGFTGTSITWLSAAGASHAEMIVELDTSPVRPPLPVIGNFAVRRSYEW